MTSSAQLVGGAIDAVRASAFTIPTDRPESDGTLAWSETTLVVAEVEGEGETGVGWSYCPAAAALLIEDLLALAVEGGDLLATGRAHEAMRTALRNAGLPGLGSMALSAVDVALWDLKAKRLDLPLAELLGAVHPEVPVYGSGGFCSYTDVELAEQLGGWVAEGIPRVKMKVGRDPSRDVERVRVARDAIGGEAELYVDANGAYATKQALLFADRFSQLDVRWFEEPVPSDDTAGLALLRERSPAGMEIAAGEYASTPAEFRRLLPVVDCLQADVTRCGGITGLLGAAALAEAHGLDLSGHTAPSIHAHALCAVPRLRHLEWFHDHVRIERLLFDGFLEPSDGAVRPDPSRPGLGVELKRADAAQYAV
jgi:L-alanine-DL-glutamate epimerase-like enolase superfamily enzyme